jgi:signal transduction histidine kinase
LVLILAVTLAVMGAVFLVGRDSPWHWQETRFARLLVAELGPVVGDPPRLHARLEKLQASLDIDMAVYNPDGRRLDGAGPNPPEALSSRESASLGQKNFFRRGRAWHLAAPLESADGAYLILGGRPSRSPGRFTASVLAILIAVALASAPLARAIARPLEQLTATARNLARGDLSARTGLARKDEVGVLAQAIDDMASRLEHRIRSEKELLANISHEIRTPLARILVALELCSEEQGGMEALKAHLAGIGDDVAELDRLVEDVLTTVRLDLGAAEGGFTLRIHPVQLAEVVDQAAKRFAAFHPTHALHRQLEDGLPAVPADPDLLKRVLDNLLDNAAKYSDPETPVELSVKQGNRQLVVEVSDRGVGIEEDDLPRVFEPFFRTDRSRARGAGGAGLGLTLCKRIVDAHGGTIAASRNPARGTTIRFTLPLPGET